MKLTVTIDYDAMKLDELIGTNKTLFGRETVEVECEEYNPFGGKGSGGSNKGRRLGPLSEEHKAKLSAKRKEYLLTHPAPCRQVSTKERLLISDRFCKTIQLIDSNGILVTIKNIEKFARDNGLSPQMIGRVANGRVTKYRGYTRPVSSN